VTVVGAEALPRDQQAFAYRVAREAIRNVIAHADARTVEVTLTTHGDRLRLTVRDDGRGFPSERRAQAAGEGHFGLLLLEERTAHARGTVEVRSEPGRGAEVELEVPLR
jgi:signal transduction histidine kinase